MPDHSDYDGAWKNALDSYFPECLALLWPQIHAQIDWTCKPVFLDKELQRLATSAKYGRLHVDKLVRVQLRTGKNLLALIHTEIQGRGQSEAGLPARMFSYHIRLREKHPQEPLVSLAVLTHRGDGPLTQTYSYTHWGCSLTFTFPVIKLENWRSRMSELLNMAPTNPFAVVILAQLEANAMHPHKLRLVRKTALVRRLYEWRFDRDQVLRLFSIMDAMLALPESMETEFVNAINQIEKETDMTYVNTIERVALRRGRQEGKLEGEQEGANQMLATLISRKFGQLPDWAQVRLSQADKATLNRWAIQVLDAERIEDIFS